MKEFAYIAGLVIIVVFLVFFRGCTPETDNFEVQIYDVPESQQRNLAEVLNNNFSRLSAKDEGKIARAEVLPNGQILLFGPKSIQNGFRDILSHMKPGKVDLNESVNYQVQVWLVAGSPVEGEKNVEPELSDVLEELKRTNPNKFFNTLERIQLILGESSNGKHVGELFQLNCELYSRNNIEHCSLILSHGPNISTRFALDTKRAIVIGSNRVTEDLVSRHKRLGELPDDTELFYILKITEL